MYKISILYKYDHFSDHLRDNYRIDCGALGLQIWMHIAIQCNIYIGMSKNLTYTLNVGAAADTVCGKGVAQCMKVSIPDTCFSYIDMKSILISAGIHRLILLT